MHHIGTELPYNKNSPHQCVRHCTFYLDIQLPVSCSFSPLAFPNRRDFCPQVRFTVYWKVAAAYKLNEEVAMQTNSAFHAIFHLSPRMGFVCESLCQLVPWLAWFGLSLVCSYLNAKGQNWTNVIDQETQLFFRVPIWTGKPGKMGWHFPVRERSGNFEQTEKVRENHTRYWKSHYLLKMDHVFSLKKNNKTLENAGKWKKNILEKSGNFFSPEKWETCSCVFVGNACILRLCCTCR